MDVLITRRRAFKSDSVVLVHKLYYKVLAGKRRAFKMQLKKDTLNPVVSEKWLVQQVSRCRSKV